MTLESLIGARLRARGWRLAVAESCTGGLLGHRLTEVAGSSDYFLGGVIAYANAVKTALLGVRPETLETWGAVSPQTALEMAEGVRQLTGATVGLSATGIAGPGGGTPLKPVGLVYLGLAAPGERRVWRHVWSGDRTANKAASAQAALEQLAAFLGLTDQVLHANARAV